MIYSILAEAKEIDENFVMVAITIIVVCFIVVKYFGMKTTCSWCGKDMPRNSEHRQKYKDLEFCSIKCSMKFLNEKADLIDKVERKNTHTKNINYNDRNKYL
jgi:hypothetical protein